MDLRARFCEVLGRATQPYIALSAVQIGSCWTHYELLVKWNQAISLTTVVEPEEAALRHYAESFLLASRLPVGEWRIADMGSGPGFPGFPIAVARPECTVTLVESIGKKASFLREAASLRNVRVSAARAEDLREPFDWVVSRAVRPKDVVRWADRLGAGVGLLLGREDAAGLRGFMVEDLPWGENRVLAIRNVPRETP